MPSLERDIYRTVQRIEKNQQDKEKKKSKVTPALARAYGLRIDYKVKQLGRKAVGNPDLDTKLDLIARMIMGVSSGNLMNLAVSQSGGLLGKAALAKGLVTEEEQIRFFSLYDSNKMLSFKQVNFINHLFEKLFDGQFVSKSKQDEALEFLQTIKKIVDSRKVNTEKLALRNGVYALIQRPMTVNGTGYIIVKVSEDGSKKVHSTEITINPRMEDVAPISLEVEARVIKNYSGPNEYREGTKVLIQPSDVHAVSEDNKRFYLTFIPDHKQTAEPVDVNGEEDDVVDKIDDVEDDLRDMQKSLKKLEKSATKESLEEKYLSDDEIQDLINSIKSKLRNRGDRDARGMLRLTKDIEKTFKSKGKLHPNSVIAIQRIATGVSGSWGKNSPDWTGKSPSGRLNKFPPSPTQYIATRT
mgnify:CR=1 FL=1